jgi:hypothetical protein
VLGNDNVIRIDQFKKKQNTNKVQRGYIIDDEYVGELYSRDLVEEFNKILQEERSPSNKKNNK